MISPEHDRLFRASTPAHFAVTASEGRWRPYKHLLYINEILIDVAAGRRKKVVVTLPPQHGKSEFVSTFFPAWFLGLFPHKPVILCSYEADFAKTFGRKARDLLQRWGPELFGVSVSRTTKAASGWKLEGYPTGGMVTAGAGGAVTGKSAALAIIDDPCKNSDDALSKTMREKTKSWYQTVLSTRLSKDGATFVIQTRWHEDDLTGWLLDMEPGDWTVVDLPAIAWHPDDFKGQQGDFSHLYPCPLGRKPGEALCPELHPLEKLQAHRHAMGEFWWSALYQQRPVPAEGGLFVRKWFKYYSMEQMPVRWDPNTGSWGYVDPRHTFDDIVLSGDLTFTSTDSSDYVVLQVWARYGQWYYLLDQFRGRRNLPDTIIEIQRMLKKWPMCRAKLIEAKANGPEVIRVLKNKVAGIVAITPTSKKYNRAAAITWMVESGMVHLLSGAEWTEAFLSEVASFPRANFDDQVDAMVQALEHMERFTTGQTITLGKRKTDWSGMMG